MRGLAPFVAATLSGFGTACSTPEAAGAPPVREHARVERGVFGASDDAVRRVLASAPISKVVKGSGGRSVAFKLSFTNGVEGYFKPEQTFAAHWFSELASYYLDRELGLGRTPPAIGRSIDWKHLSAHLGDDPRTNEVVVRNGVVRGSLVFWLPEKPVPIELPSGWEAWLRVDDNDFGLSPFLRYELYERALQRGARGQRKRSTVPPPPDFADRPAELSDLILFDYLIGNLDRWSRNLTNVRALGASKPLIFLDNANGFHLQKVPGRTLQDRLTAVQRFRRKTVDAISALDVNKFERRMSADPLAPVLTKRHLLELEDRRRRLLEHVADVRQRYGDRAVFW